MPDLEIQNEGTVFLVRPQTAVGLTWLNENLEVEPWQKFGEAVAVDHRCVGAIVEGAQADGLSVV